MNPKMYKIIYSLGLQKKKNLKKDLISIQKTNQTIEVRNVYNFTTLSISKNYQKTRSHFYYEFFISKRANSIHKLV